MKNTFAVFILLIFGLSMACTPLQKDEPAEPVSGVEEEVPETAIIVRIPDHQFRFSSLQLNASIEKTDLKAFRHFGEFYTENFTIYRLRRLDYLAESHYIDDINLYFIDSLLVKIQAFLREDRTREFVNKYGKAKIFIHDYHNKKLLEREDLLVKENGKYRLNKNLDRYTLKWFREEVDIVYEVNKKSDTTETGPLHDLQALDQDRYRYRLTFQTKDYQHRLAWIKWEAYKESRGLN